jgi:hypothetical protein
MVIVHLGRLLFIGLIGGALYMLVRDLPGTVARISRLAIGSFVRRREPTARCPRSPIGAETLQPGVGPLS